MNSLLHRVFSPPVFPADRDKTARARLFNLCHWFTASWLLLTVVGNFLGGRIPLVVSGTMLLAIAVGGIPYWMVKRGRLELGATLWLIHAFAMATLGLAMLGTIRAPALGYYLILVMCAGFVFGGRGMLVSVGASSLAVAGLIVAQNARWLPTPDYSVSITQWITAAAFFACVGGVSYVAMRQMRGALAIAEAEVGAHQRTEAELRQVNAQLEAALRKVKTLDGLLPICAWCRKVRADEGYWSALENYVTAHTDATFTHGICPDCRQRHFDQQRECKRVE